MTTCSQLLENVRLLTQGGVNDEVNRLSQPYSPGDTRITLQYEPRGFGQGSRFSIGLNTFLSWSVSTGAREIECQGGEEGSIDAPIPAGTVVRVRPRVTDHSILVSVNQDIQRISTPMSGLYAVGTWNPVVDPVDQAWLVPAEHLAMERLLAIRFTPAGMPDRWLEANGTLRVSGGEKRVVMDTMLSPSDTVEITYSRPFTLLTSLDDEVEAETGLAPGMVAIPVYGAAGALAMSQESRRNMLLAQSDTRRPDEVPAGALTGVAREFMRQRQVLIDSETTRLQRTYPYRRAFPVGGGF